MSQYDFTMTSGTGIALLANIASLKGALQSANSGPSEPSYKVAGTLWLDTTTSTLLVLKMWDGTQWQVLVSFNPSNADAFRPGELIRRTRFVTSDAAFALHPMTRLVRAKAKGAGGAGGGATVSTAGAAAAGSGGNAGEELWTELEDPGGSTVAVTIGAGGAGASGAAGGDGGDTTITINSVSYVAAGGLGGRRGPQSLLLLYRKPITQTTSTVVNGEFRIAPALGQPALYGGTGVSSTARALGGMGGNSPWGQGGLGHETAGGASGAGAAARGRGAGGGGASATSSGSVAGGAGASGVVELEEFA